MCDIVMMRTYSQSNLEEFASYSTIPVINGLSDEFHPVQLMADYLTITEYNLDKNLTVAYVGDGNNIAHSWLNLAALLGFELRIATPKGYEVNQDILQNALSLAKYSNVCFKSAKDTP
jgi:ornithine carbamoyltransferase